ncbi:hypothetical protein BIY24_07715 [Halobacteriovorax marinus]|uniref:hypothetical protein n=1 Tax=Halobacteriovorax marinus TaxID=97084 RepID=UPI0003045C01|nr:hypothetical protein [Halobacteriovorax marinus]ATH07839.1 hypothetical protein BIY24_07715 [Halobacteriovorax marinus]
MKVDVDIDKFSQSYLLKFEVKNFKSPDDYKMAVTTVTCFSNDYDLDPELDHEDMREIVEKTIELEKDFFVFEINDEGIEVDI